MIIKETHVCFNRVVLYYFSVRIQTRKDCIIINVQD